MTETIHLFPPTTGPQSDPLLYGVAQALETMFPVSDVDRARSTSVDDLRHTDDAEEAEAA